MPGSNSEPVALSALSDETLVLRAQQGSLPCFAELLRRFEGKVFNFIQRRVGGGARVGGAAHSTDAEDLTQETFLRAWEHLRSFTPRYKFSTWLFTIAGRVAIDHLRNRRVRRDALDTLRSGARDQADNFARPSDGQVGAGGSALWDHAARVLNAEQHTALWLRYAEDLAPPEIGRVLGRSQVAVRVMLFRARKTLARTLNHVDSDSADAEPAPETRRLGRAQRNTIGGGRNGGRRCCMSWNSSHINSALEERLSLEAPLAQHLPPAHLRSRMLRALEQSVRENADGSMRRRSFAAHDRQRGLAVALGIAAVIGVSVTATLQVPPSQPVVSPLASAAPPITAEPRLLADAIPEGAMLVVSTVSSRVASVDDPLRDEAIALRNDLGRALTHLRQSVGLGMAAP